MSQPQVMIADVLRVVAEHYGVKLLDLRAARKHRALSHARRVAYWLARETTTQGYTAIGRALGNRDHATIIYGCAELEKQIAGDAELRAEVEGLRIAVNGVARLRERRMVAAPAEIDPHAVARRVAAGGERVACMVSIEEIAAVCLALTGHSHELETLRRHDDAARKAAEALRAQRQALYTPQERDAQRRLERALKDLSNAFEEESVNG